MKAKSGRARRLAGLSHSERAILLKIEVLEHAAQWGHVSQDAVAQFKARSEVAKVLAEKAAGRPLYLGGD